MIASQLAGAKAMARYRARKEKKALEREERRLARERAKAVAATWNQLQMTAYCPATTSLRVRAGWVQQGSYWITQETIWFPELELDFTDPTQFLCDFWGQTYTGNFSNADWFMPLLVMYSNDYFSDLRDGLSTWGPIRNYGGSPEVATALEAEQTALGWLEGNDVIYEGDLPLALVILRNNGVVGVDGAVLPVDPQNRGRSYIWRDIRPRNICPWFVP